MAWGASVNAYIHPGWRSTLIDNGLTGFDAFWNMDLPLLDTPNTSRGGFSSVARMDLKGNDTTQRTLIIKRQQNHNSRTWRHPLKGLPTTQKEFANILRFKRRDLETVTPVFFARRRVVDGDQAILATAYLEGYLSLEDFLRQWIATPKTDLVAKRRVLRLTAKWVRRMHHAGFQHNCLYTKHIFVNPKDSRVPVRGIDLEKVRWQIRATKRWRHDLSSLFRRTAGLSRTDRLCFLQHYFGADMVNPEVRRAWHRIHQAMARKKS